MPKTQPLMPRDNAGECCIECGTYKDLFIIKEDRFLLPQRWCKKCWEEWGGDSPKPEKAILRDL